MSNVNENAGRSAGCTGGAKAPTGHLASLWSALSAFSLDVRGAPYPLSARLADEQDWTIEFTAAAIEEYKRFIFLAAVSGQTVTPSLVVDEVWHTHLIYTRSYWEEMGDIVGRLIHHDPGSGEAADEALFAGLYLRTLNSYRRFFGEPPSDIWGPENGKHVLPKGRKKPA